jgi:hypothetical protein
MNGVRGARFRLRAFAAMKGLRPRRRGADLAHPLVRTRPRTRPRPRRRCTAIVFEDEDEDEDDLNTSLMVDYGGPPMGRDASTGPNLVLRYTIEVSYEVFRLRRIRKQNSYGMGHSAWRMGLKI